MSDAVVQEQAQAPDFTLEAIGDAPFIKDGYVHLADLAGHTVVLYFYPRDNTPGCTKEACSFRDANHLLQQRGVVVLGVSTDGITSHKKFAEKYSLPFPLLSDPEKQVVERYSVWKEKSLYGRKYMGVNRETFLIDKDGIVRKIWHKVSPAAHAEEVLKTVEQLDL